MAELIVSAVLPVLFEKLMSAELLNFATQEGVREKLKKWERTLKMIKALLADAEDKQLTNEAVKMWLEDLQDLAYDAEDILDEYATEALRRKLKIQEHQAASTSRARKLIPACCLGFTPSALWSDFGMRSKIDDITSRLDDLCRQRTELGLLEIAGGRSTTASLKRPPTSSLQTELDVYGRDEDIAKILKMVFTDEPGYVINFGVIAIVGMGGLGKTTLAQQVYNHQSLEVFNPKAWVCVSDDFDVMRISTAILESITRNPCNLNDLDAVQNQLKEKLSGRKFLIVLDDVWSENYNKWATLRSPFMVGAHGSKIIVTTRHERVAFTMGCSTDCHRLKRLSDDDCWLLFKKYAFDNEVMGAQLSGLIPQKVIEKCDGLPLVAKTLGGLLRFEKRYKWLDILSSKLWELLDKSEIPAALLISYHHLPSHLKRCFAYCAILPKDYEFEETELVFLWMAEGLIQQSSKYEQLEDLGGEYFGDLISRSIFQISSSNSSKYTMLALVYDLAQKVSKKLSFRLDDEPESNDLLTISKKTRYASYICHEYNDKRRFEVFNDALHLRTHLSVPRVNNKWVTKCFISNIVVSDLLSRFKKLRVLSLQKYYIIELPNSIGGLRLLRYLNLSESEIRSLPESINSLCNLQTLLLRNCRRLLNLPYSMGNLIYLRHLDISGASLIVDMPMGIIKWEHLRTLSNFIVGKGSRLNELEHLKFLCGELHISRLENMIGFEDTMKSILSDKKDLKVLLLEWSFESNHDVRHEKVLDKLRPHQNIEELTIKGYGGINFPIWVGDISFSEMTVLKLENCNRCICLPSLGMLCSLKSLLIKGMKRIKRIGSEFYGQPWSNPFLSLETLCFEDLEELEHWDNNKENEGVTILPSLRNLSVVRCPKLSQRLPNNLSLLEKLVIRECAQLVENSIQKSTQWLSGVTSLKELHIGNCKTLTTLIEVIEQNNKLEEFRIEGCHDPTFVFRGHPPVSLERLDVRNCEKLQCLFDDNEDSSSCSSSSMINKENGNISTCHLRDLYVQDCPSLACVLSIHQLSATVVHLSIKKCSNLTNLSLPAVLKYLEIEECSELSTLLPIRDYLPEKLVSLKISWCPKLESIVERFHNNTYLYEIWVVGCEKLKSIPDGLHTLSSLADIRISYCANLVSFPGGGFPDTYLSVGIKASEKLKALPQVHTLTSLWQLSLWDCPSLSFPAEGLPTNLESLAIQGHKLYEKLEEVGLQNVTSLGNLSICGLPDILLFRVEEIRISLPPYLTQLYIGHFSNLKDLSSMGLEKLTSLQWLSIHNCPHLKSLPSQLPSSLLAIYINECPLLAKKEEWTKLTGIPCIMIDGKFIQQSRGS